MAHMVLAVIFVAVPSLAAGAQKECEKTDKWEASVKMNAPCGNLMDRADGKGRCASNRQDLSKYGPCNAHDGTDKATCEAVSGDSGSPFDSSKNKCYWLEPFADDAAKKAGCELSTRCKYEEEEDNCVETEDSIAGREAWSKGKGLETCSARVASGCVDNNNHRNPSPLCTQHKDETACLAVDKETNGESCGWGICSGNSTTGTCAGFKMEHDCTSHEGCTFAFQCCQWLGGPPEDFESVCLTGPKGYEATIAGLCEIKEDGYKKCMNTECPMVAATKWPSGWGQDKDKDVQAIKDGGDVQKSVKCLCEKCGNFKEIKEWSTNEGGAACSAAGAGEASDSRSPFLALGVVLVLGMASMV